MNTLIGLALIERMRQEQVARGGGSGGQWPQGGHWSQQGQWPQQVHGLQPDFPQQGRRAQREALYSACGPDTTKADGTHKGHSRNGNGRTRTSVNNLRSEFDSVNKHNSNNAIGWNDSSTPDAGTNESLVRRCRLRIHHAELRLRLCDERGRSF